MSGHLIYLQDDDQKVPEELQCTYCGLVLNEPVETSETGLRVCDSCFDNASKGPYQCDLHQEDIPISILQVKEQIDNLKVKCENYTVGCDWKGLFKQLMQHSQDCQYVIRECNPGCGQRMPLIKMDNHLKNECHQRLIYCDHCDKEMYFIELSSHTEECYNAPRICRNCNKEIPASQVESEYFYDHLQDTSKLADHLGPMICEFTKMSEAFKEMTMSHRLMTNKVEMIQKRNGFLEKEVEQLKKEVNDMKAAKGDGKAGLEGSSSNVLLKTPSLNETSIYTEQAVLHQTNYNTIHYENPTNAGNVLYIKTIESKLERNIQSLQEQLNSSNAKAYGDQVSQYEEVLAAYKARLSDFEQTSMPTCSANGEYVWPISDMNEKISDARSGRRIYIDSPPFYTGRNGYKMCIRAYFNGDGSGYHTHLSIFFALMKGEYDPLLQWPFESKVSLILVDQDHQRNLAYSFKPDPQSSSFQRPKTDMNVPSGCPEFASLAILDNTSYVKDDVMYIKATVESLHQYQ